MSLFGHSDVLIRTFLLDPEVRLLIPFCFPRVREGDVETMDAIFGIFFLPSLLGKGLFMSRNEPGGKLSFLPCGERPVHESE